MQIGDVAAYLHGTYRPTPRASRRVDLAVPALCRDAVDRLSPVASILWLLAALVYVAWVLLFLFFTLGVIVQTGNLFGFVEDDWFQALALTGMAGWFLWSQDSGLRILIGSLLALFAGTLVFGTVTQMASSFAGYFFEAKAEPPVAPFLNLILGPLLVSVYLELLVVGLALVLFGRRGFWPAFSDTGRAAGRWSDGILYGLGVTHEGFFPRRGARPLMVLGKVLLAIGIIAALPGYLVLALTLEITPVPPDPNTDEYRLVGGIMLGATALGFAASAGIGLWFRRLFPPQRLREGDDSGKRPIFLRSFRDDSVRLRGPWPLAPIPLPPDVPRNLDEIILARFPDAVAFGRPGEQRTPFGVSRRYVDEAQWRDRVSEVLDRSELLLVCIDETAGLQWEIGELLARGYAGKTKFFMHPTLSGERKRELGRALGVTIAEKDLRRLRGMDSAAGGEVRLYLGAANGATYRCMLGWMIAR